MTHAFVTNEPAVESGADSAVGLLLSMAPGVAISLGRGAHGPPGSCHHTSETNKHLFDHHKLPALAVQACHGMILRLGRLQRVPVPVKNTSNANASGATVSSKLLFIRSPELRYRM